MRFDGTEEQLEVVREISEGLTDPVFLVDRNFNVWHYNRAFEAVVGIRLGSRRYKGAPCHQLLGLTICKDHCVMKQAVESNETVRLAEIDGRNSAGEDHTFHITAIPLTKADGVAFGALIFLRDITAEATIHRKYKQVVSQNSAISLSGQIDKGNLPDIIQLFAFLQKTGHLMLQNGGEAGEIVFDGGRMIHVSSGSVDGEKAFGRLVGWDQGTFSFTAKDKVEVAKRIEKSSDFMLMDALREKDEVAARQSIMPSLDAKPTVLRIAHHTEDELSDVVWRVYEFGLEGKSVRQMIDQVTESDHKVLLALFQLRDKGIVSW